MKLVCALVLCYVIFSSSVCYASSDTPHMPEKKPLQLEGVITRGTPNEQQTKNKTLVFTVAWSQKDNSKKK